MSTSIQRMWIHAVWTTKEKLPIITKEIEKPLFDSMYEEFALQGSPALIIGGAIDHVHCLFQLSATKNVADVLRHVKGSSSHHINSLKLVEYRFAWQTGYMSFALSEKEHQKVKQMIREQKKYHERISVEHEFSVLLAENNLSPDLFDHPSRMVA